ncbi:MAG TPA: methylenetetrahydrofolate reductase C-terminal domain-containing protein [Methylomirabilota bacterium]|jgi:methylenetetrahydrofolate reductase (NADPH)|nr:methylenetetrahydrofolate reductase C-terminal domain-containing protein [Methylomirabilota bacterium]
MNRVVVNQLRQRLARGEFVVMVEITPGRGSRVADHARTAAALTAVPQIAAASITSNAGGHPGEDPIPVARAVADVGLTPNVHLTCVWMDRRGLGRDLDRLQALGLENVFAMTGDWPAEQTRVRPRYDLDSVQLTAMIAERRAAGFPFHVAVAVSPFKSTEAETWLQYLKLEKKRAAGADVAITQLGFDVPKFTELARYRDEHCPGLPLIGCGAVLTRRVAEKIAAGELAGCTIAPTLLAAVRRESGAPDGGRAAALERTAQLIAVLRGLGYAGVYLVGLTRRPRELAELLARAEALAPRWKAAAEALALGHRDGFLLYERGGPDHRWWSFPSARHRLFSAVSHLAPTPGTRLHGLLQRAARAVERRPGLVTLTRTVEQAIKIPTFGCKECGNCVLSYMEYVCPMTCPKDQRNGACGGSTDGWCEVERKPCIWIEVYENAKRVHRVAGLKTYVPPPDRSLHGTSSWLNYFLGRDVRPRDDDPGPRPAKESVR